jgi:glyoxylate utilization-related uncharacterized protein
VIFIVAPNGNFSGQVTSGSDQYFYTFQGAVEVVSGGQSYSMTQDSFCIIQEGTSYTLRNTSSTQKHKLWCATTTRKYRYHIFTWLYRRLQVVDRTTQPVLQRFLNKRKSGYFLLAKSPQRPIVLMP